jgi:uncharacterized protein YabE (DUF348 family)
MIKQLHKKYAIAHQRRVRALTRVAKKPLFTIPFATFMVLLALVGVAFVVLSGGKPQLRPDDPNIVVITDGRQERTIPTRAKTVGELLKRLQIPMHKGDIVEPAASTEIIGDNFRVNLYRAVPVTIVDGARKTFAYSAAATPRSIVKQAGLNVFPEDRLQLLPTENFLTESSIGERVVIDRATPVNMNLYGTPLTVRTHAKTVADLLKEKNINLGKDDSVQPSLTEPLSAASQIFLVRKGTQLATEEQAIPMPVETVQDNSLTFGTVAVRQYGAPGKKLVTYQVDLQNGREVGRRLIQEVVALEPVKQVEAKGVNFNPGADKTAVMAAAGIKSSDYMYVDYIVSRESGWCHTKWQGEFGGCKAYHGTPSSSGVGYGLCQATPGNKMSSAGADWGSNPVTQMKWCSGYATSRYGSWAGAYAQWQKNNWW